MNYQNTLKKSKFMKNKNKHMGMNATKHHLFGFYYFASLVRHVQPTALGE